MLLTQLAAVGPVATVLQSELPGVPRGNLCFVQGDMDMSQEHGCGTVVPEISHLKALWGNCTRLRSPGDSVFLPPFFYSTVFIKCLLYAGHWARHWGCHMQEDSQFS